MLMYRQMFVHADHSFYQALLNRVVVLMHIMTSLLAYLVLTIHKIYTVLAMLIVQRDATTAFS